MFMSLDYKLISNTTFYPNLSWKKLCKLTLDIVFFVVVKSKWHYTCFKRKHMKMRTYCGWATRGGVVRLKRHTAKLILNSLMHSKWKQVLESCRNSLTSAFIHHLRSNFANYLPAKKLQSMHVRFNVRYLNTFRSAVFLLQCTITAPYDQTFFRLTKLLYK